MHTQWKNYVRIGESQESQENMSYELLILPSALMFDLEPLELWESFCYFSNSFYGICLIYMAAQADKYTSYNFQNKSKFLISVKIGDLGKSWNNVPVS